MIALLITVIPMIAIASFADWGAFRNELFLGVGGLLAVCGILLAALDHPTSIRDQKPTASRTRPLALVLMIAGFISVAAFSMSLLQPTAS